jgi:hypothetical protein
LEYFEVLLVADELVPENLDSEMAQNYDGKEY